MAGNLPQVGLEAVIAGMPGFNSGAKAITDAYDNIEKKASGVEKATQNLGSAFSSFSSPLSALSGQFVGLGQNVLKFGAIAGGAALVGVGALTAGIVALGGTALGEFAKYERMSLSITNLVAREISQGQVVEQQKQGLATLTATETAELEKLKGGLDNEINSRDVLSARIQEQKQRIIDLTAQYGDQGLVVIKERAELQGMELDLADLNTEISTHQGRITELFGKEGQLITVMEKVRVGQMSMSDAMTQAGPRAQELLKWIQLLAIQSPFSQEGVANAFRTALAYGFTTEQAQRLTKAELDFASATGKGEEVTNQIALALGQMQAKGKVSGQEIIQLTNAGVGVNKILGDMGFTLDDVSNGLVSADDFIEAVIKDMEVFSGAGKEQSNTFAGLGASLGDLKDIGLREFFTGTFNAIQPYLAQFVGFLTKAALETGSIRKLGNALGQYVAGALKNIGKFIATIKAGGLAVFSKYLGTEGIPLWYQLKELIGNISTALTGLGQLFTANLSGPMSDFTSNIIPMITQGLAFINDHFEEFKGALMGIGGILAVGVFAAIVAGILSLLTPINLIIAGAALLGAAWAGNWGDIQGKTFAVWAVVQPVLSQIVTWLQTNIPIAIQTVSAFWTNTLLPAMVQIGAWITGTLIPTLMNVWNWLQTNIPLAIQTVSTFWTDTFLPTLTAVSAFISGIFMPVFQNIADQWTFILIPALTAVWSFINDSLMPVWVSFIGLIDAIIIKVGEALVGAFQNLLLPALTGIWSFFNTQLMPIWVKFIDFVNDNVTKAIQAITGLFGGLNEAVGGDEGLGPIISNFTDDILPAFKTGMEGINDLLKKAADFFGSLATSVMNFELPPVLQPGSPTPFEVALRGIADAANQAGQAMTGMITQSTIDSILGLKRNIASNDAIIQLTSRNLRKYYERIELESGKRGLAVEQLTRAFRQNQAEIMGATDKVAKFQEVTRRMGLLGGNIFSGVQGDRARRGFTQFINDFERASNMLKKAQQEALIEAGRTALDVGNKLNDVVESSADILNTRIDTLQELVDSGLAEVNYEGEIISATRAQELLNQALEDQRDIQDDILQLRQNEQKLNFLEKQLNLIETINEAGLNVQDILGGLTLGVDASIPDLIEATNRLVTAMINQVNEDLQIASPSKVMTGLFRQVGMGAVRGLMDTIPIVQSAASQIKNAIINVPAGQVGGNTYSSTTNNNFNLSVGTLDSAPAVIGQFQNMRAMA